MKCSLGISQFLEEISSLSHSVVFLYFFALLAKEGFLIFPYYSWNSAFKWECLSFSFLFFSQLFVRPPQTATLLFFISFPWGWSWSLSPVQCQEPPSIVHQALCLVLNSHFKNTVTCIPWGRTRILPQGCTVVSWLFFQCFCIPSLLWLAIFWVCPLGLVEVLEAGVCSLQKRNRGLVCFCL